MKRLASLLLRALALLVAVTPALVHFFITAPWLIAHGSSAAFDLAIAGWIVVVLWGGALWRSIYGDRK